MRQKVDTIMAALNDDHSNKRVTGLTVAYSTDDGGIKYRYSTYVASHPGHFIGYLSAMCSELTSLLIHNHK